MNNIDHIEKFDEAIELLKTIRKRFWTNTLIPEDLEYVKVVNDKKITKSKSINTFSWEVESYGKVFGGSEIGGFLDRKSKAELKRFSWPYNCCLLVLKPSSMIYEVLLSHGFYHFNPHRSIPDSVIAFKKM